MSSTRLSRDVNHVGENGSNRWKSMSRNSGKPRIEDLLGVWASHGNKNAKIINSPQNSLIFEYIPLLTFKNPKTLSKKF